jgi:uncharacterized membrane protein YphA (DoxX/SURF4 family)
VLLAGSAHNLRGQRAFTLLNRKLNSEESMKAPFLVGRLLFGGFFIFSGINHFKQTKSMAQYAAAKKIPKPDIAVQVSGAVLIAGGASVLLGIKPKMGTAAIIGFLAGVSPLMHDFWKKENPEERANHMVNFMKNVALLGAAMALMGVEDPWPASIEELKPSARRSLKRFLREKMAA